MEVLPDLIAEVMDPHTRSHLVQRVQKYFLENLGTVRPVVWRPHNWQVSPIHQHTSCFNKYTFVLYLFLATASLRRVDPLSFNPTWNKVKEAFH